jgi:glycosyltransferase involved in cell wall biosynthesis/8-oxo-dGTP pyrophosphatase MutT (NUDIX family)
MKILVLAPYSRPWDVGDSEGSGMNVFIKESIEALVDAGHEVRVCIRKSREDDPVRLKVKENLELVFIEAGSAERMGRHDTYRALEQSVLSDGVVAEVDLVIAHYWLSEPWIQQVVKMYHGRVLYFSHSFSLNPYRESFDLLQLKSEMTLVPRVTWCAYSEAEFSIMSDTLPDNRVFHIPPGVNLDQNVTKGDRSDEVIFIGRKNKAKGYDLFCEVATSFQNLSFVAVGRKEKEEIDTRVENIDFLPLPELQARIASARLVVCPSRYEHFGLVPLLSLALGTPVVATNRGGFTDVIKAGETGELSETDSGSLKNAIEKCLDTIKLPLAADEIRHIQHKYSWQTWVEEVIRIGMKKDNLLQTKFLDVSVTPKEVNGRVVWFEKVSLPGSVHVIPENEDGSYEFIIEDRPQENVTHKLRVLSGVIDKGEDPVQAAHRELLEEIGWYAKDMELLWHSSTKGAVVDHRYYFIARSIDRYGKAAPENTELIKGTSSLQKEEVFESVKRGDFGESFTAIALLKLCGILPTDKS